MSGFKESYINKLDQNRKSSHLVRLIERTTLYQYSNSFECAHR